MDDVPIALATTATGGEIVCAAGGGLAAWCTVRSGATRRFATSVDTPIEIRISADGRQFLLCIAELTSGSDVGSDRIRSRIQRISTSTGEAVGADGRSGGVQDVEFDLLHGIVPIPATDLFLSLTGKAGARRFCYWKAQTGAVERTAPAPEDVAYVCGVCGDDVIATGKGGVVGRADPRTGTWRWRDPRYKSTDSGNRSPWGTSNASVLVGGKTIVVIESRPSSGSEAAQCRVVALDATTGAMQWETDGEDLVAATFQVLPSRGWTLVWRGAVARVLGPDGREVGKIELPDFGRHAMRAFNATGTWIAVARNDGSVFVEPVKLLPTAAAPGVRDRK